MAAYVAQSAAALGVGRQAQAAGPVDKHLEQVALGVDTQVRAASASRPLTTYTVDRWGNTLSMTDPRDANWITTYTYNGNDQLLGTTTPFALTNGVVSDTSVTSTSYDRLGRVVATTDARGYVNKLEYDSNGNVVAERHADTGVVASTYNLFGERLSVAQPGATSSTSGVKTLYAYDHFGNLQSVTTDATAAVYSFTGVMGTADFKLTTTPTSRRLVETYSYDELGRRTGTVDAAGVATSKQYDAAGNVVSETDARGYTSYRTYDALGHLIAQVDATGTHRQTWNVDSQGRVISHANEDKNASGQWIKPLDVKYTYDNAGRLVLQHSLQGQDIAYGYVGEQLRTIYDQGTGQLTTYGYDLSGNRTREETVYASTMAIQPNRRQNNTSTYDLQNRLTSVKDDLYTLTFEYDKNGNRTATHSSYGQQATHAYNTYDAMNRQLIVNGVKDAAGNVVIGAIGHRLTYDLAGNRKTDTYIGVKLTYSGSTWSSTANAETTETYAYDSVGRLSSATRDGMLIDRRYYDAAGRVLQSGMVPAAVTNVGTRSAFDKVVAAAGINKQFSTFAYDNAGHMYRQVTRDFDSKVLSDIYLVYDEWNHEGGYDANGNLTGYTAVENGKKIFYYINYTWRDGAQQTSTSVRRDGETKVNTTTTQLDVNGNRSLILENGVERSRLWYDADGHVQQKIDKGVESFAMIVNGQVLGYEDQKADNILGTTYSTIGQGGPQGDATFYNVQSASEKLSSIAQAIWGDQNLWYLIADANDLSYDSTLSVGQTLRIPQRATTVHNDADTFRPYDAGAAIGDTTPLPTPAKADKHGCGVVGKIAAIAIAAVVTYFAGPALGKAVGMTLGYALGGAAGSVASQAFSMATGMQDKFSWNAVALSAVSSGVSYGVADQLGAAQNWQGAAVRGALSSTITQGISVATGLQNGFSWRSVAASAAGAAVGNSIYDKTLTDAGAKFGNAFASGFAAGTTAAVFRGGRVSVTQVATDAFGNALGSSLADLMRSSGSHSVRESGASGGNDRSGLSDVIARANATPERGAMNYTDYGYEQALPLAERLGLVSAPQMSMAPNGNPGSGDYLEFSTNLPETPVSSELYQANATYHRGRTDSVAADTNASAMGITDAQVDAAIARGETNGWDAASYAARVTGYKAWNFVTAGFVERHDVRLQASANGRLSDANFWKATAIDGGVSVASILAAGQVGGYVTGRVGNGYLGSALTGAAVGGTSDLALQWGKNAAYLATNGQTGSFGFSGSEFATVTALGGAFGFGGKYLSKYGHYNVQLRSYDPRVLYSNPLLFELVAPEGPVVFRAPPGATAEEIAQVRAYVNGSNDALRAGQLSPTGRVSTAGELRTDASIEAALERARAASEGVPYQGHAGHVPDTTWTGNGFVAQIVAQRSRWRTG